MGDLKDIFIRAGFMFCFLFNWILYAGDDASLLRVRIPYKEQAKVYPEVKGFRENITVQKIAPRELAVSVSDNEKSVKSVTPQDSLAAKFFIRDKIFSWRPTWHYQVIGGPKLPAVAMSGDFTVLGIAETVGKDQGPYASRIILFNCCSLEILNFIELKDRIVKRLLFIPGTNMLLCFCGEQAVMDQLPGILILDLISGKEIAFIPMLPPEDIAVSANGKKIFVKPVGKPSFYILSMKRVLKMPFKPHLKNRHTHFIRIKRILKQMKKDGSVSIRKMLNIYTDAVLKKVPLKSNRVCLSLDKDNKLLMAAGSKAIEVFNFKGKLLKEINLNLNCPLKSAMFAGEKNYLITTADNRALLFKNGARFFIASNASGIAAYVKDKGWLCVNLYKKSEIRILKLLTLKKLFSLYPRKGKPRTRGDLQFVSFLPYGNEKFLILDSKGNLFLMYKKGKRRWKKYLITSAAR